MRATADTVTVRLYHLDGGPEGGAATTLFYGPLPEAIRLGELEPVEVQEHLFIATDNDVIGFLDLLEG